MSVERVWLVTYVDEFWGRLQRVFGSEQAAITFAANHNRGIETTAWIKEMEVDH